MSLPVHELSSLNAVRRGHSARTTSVAIAIAGARAVGRGVALAAVVVAPIVRAAVVIAPIPLVPPAVAIVRAAVVVAPIPLVPPAIAIVQAAVVVAAVILRGQIPSEESWVRSQDTVLAREGWGR